MLVLRNGCRRRIRVGRLGSFSFPRGWYLYVGSAFGPGGVAARCNHHRRVSEHPRWHIDYLRAQMALREIWFCHGPVRREHQWAAILAADPVFDEPVTGFGASDCNCVTHLFYAPVKPAYGEFYSSIVMTAADSDEIHCELV